MRARVLQAAADWVWVPPDAHDFVETDYRLTLYPGHATVQWSATDRPIDTLVTEIIGRSASQPRIRWWIDEHTTPTGTADALLRHGFERVETVEILARDLADADDLVERLNVSSGVRTRLADNTEALRRAVEFDAESFGWSMPPLEHIEQEANDPATGRFLVSVDNLDVGSAGYTLVDGVLVSGARASSRPRDTEARTVPSWPRAARPAPRPAPPWRSSKG